MRAKSVRLIATWVVEYDVLLEHYDTTDPNVAASIDTASDDVVGLMADAETVSFRVEVAKP